MEHFGSLAWSARSRGTVRGWERAMQVLQAVRFRLRQRFRARAQPFEVGSPAAFERLLGEIELPQTTQVAHAATLVTELGPAPLVGHAFRTWAWGVLLAARDGLTYNRESFALAALLHDLALARRSPNVECFAVDGAQQALELLRDWNAPESQQHVVSDAICLHLRVAVPASLGVEAHLVHAGAGLDVVGGTDYESLPPALRERVLERYPRREFKRYLCNRLREEQVKHPQSRMGLWVSMGFLESVASSPFIEP